MDKDILEITDLKDMLNKTRKLYGNKIGYKIKIENEFYNVHSLFFYNLFTFYNSITT